MLLTLFPYIALALNLILVLGLFFGVNRTLWKLRSRVSACEGKLESTALQISRGNQRRKPENLGPGGYRCRAARQLSGNVGWRHKHDPAQQGAEDASHGTTHRSHRR